MSAVNEPTTKYGVRADDESRTARQSSKALASLIRSNRELHIGVPGETSVDIVLPPSAGRLLLKALEEIGKGRDVRVYDPHIQLDQIYGSNRNFVLSAIPHIGKLMVRRLEDLAGWAEYLVVTQKPSAKMADAIQNAGVPVLDIASDAPAPRRVAQALV